MMVEFSQPLIPGCFIPLSTDHNVWVDFRYEGIFKFCKKCVCIGHYPSHCNLSTHAAHSRIRRKLEAFDMIGYRVLVGPMNIPYYTNMVEGLPDKFRFRNQQLNLFSMGSEFNAHDSSSSSSGHDGDDDQLDGSDVMGD